MTTAAPMEEQHAIIQFLTLMAHAMTAALLEPVTRPMTQTMIVAAVRVLSVHSIYPLA